LPLGLLELAEASPNAIPRRLSGVTLAWGGRTSKQRLDLAKLFPEFSLVQSHSGRLTV
jgi:hypothetical protein